MDCVWHDWVALPAMLLAVAVDAALLGRHRPLRGHRAFIDDCADHPGRLFGTPSRRSRRAEDHPAQTSSQ
jgi:hypothetical protein